MSAGNKTILIVDDEPHIVHILRYKLEHAGYTVETAEDGEAGFEMAQELDPNLIVTDFQMPIMNGYEMSVKLHETEQTTDTPVVMVTARGHKLSPHELAKTNIRQLICKPFSARELLTVVEELMREYGGYEEESEDEADAA